jgi:DNA-binding SARP family transcriptional activator
MHTPYRLKVFGTFRFTGANGDVVRISSKRGKCLIVSLLLSDDWSRDRFWLQEFLWPDRPKEHASLSLRQELRNLRKLLGEGLFVSEDMRVRLNRNLVVNDPFEEQNLGEDILEGVSLQGKLGDWVQNVRLYWHKPEMLAAKSNFVPTIGFSSEQDSQRELTSDLLFSDLVSKGLHDLGRVETVSGRLSNGEDPFLNFSISHLNNRGRVSMRLALTERPNARLHWSANWHQLLSDLGASGTTGEETRTKFFQLSFRAQEATEDALIELVGANSKVSALVLAFQAMRETFSMDPKRVIKAEQMLDLAYEMEPGAAILALKGLVRTNQVFERTASDLEVAKAQALEYARRALVLEPENSLVRALCSNTLLALSGDNRIVGEYAREAIELNPANPMAWSTFANANVAEGRMKEAEKAAARALEISKYSKNRHWWEMNSCVAAVARGDLAVAREHAKVAHFLAPTFRPPLRFIVLLAYQANDLLEFEDAKRKLRLLEPDFDEHCFSDPEYPTGALRAAGLTKLKKLWF